jgi:hypothetical protein
MKRRISLAFVCLLASVALALTPAERRVVEDARGKLKEATAQFEQVKAKLGDAGRQIEEANKHAAESDARAAAAETHAASADQHAAETDLAAKKTGEEIETAHKNEQTMANAVAEMKPIYDQVYKYWGIGAIILGAYRYRPRLVDRQLFLPCHRSRVQGSSARDRAGDYQVRGSNSPPP